MELRDVKTPDELLECSRPIRLSTERFRSIFKSGKQAKKWAKDNGLVLEPLKPGIRIEDNGDS